MQVTNERPAENALTVDKGASVVGLHAQLALELMSSNLVPKAQKVAWELFPDERPGRIVAAISERCPLAVAKDATISEKHRLAHSVSRGIRV